MAQEWMSDTRKIPDETTGYLRKVAARAIEEKAYSLELIVDILKISRPSVYDGRIPDFPTVGRRWAIKAGGFEGGDKETVPWARRWKGSKILWLMGPTV
jgi:hypothetical protein